MKELLDNPMGFFPYYFKEHDSYKELGKGKGLLERFLNICTEYFKDYPKSDLDNFLEILDINKTPNIYINNFWKFFGELPFAKGPIINPDLFNETFTGFNFDRAIEIATVSQEDLTGITNINYRDILKYAIALFKIRGTTLFFNVMFRLYGMTVRIETHNKGVIQDPFVKQIPIMDDPYNAYDKDLTFDNHYTCHKCTNVIFNVTVPVHINISDINAKVNLGLEYVKQVRSFIERFVPFYINPIIRVKGNAAYNQVIISVNTSEVNIPEGSSEDVEVTVRPAVLGNPGVSLAYQVAITDGSAPDANTKWSITQYTSKKYPLRLPSKTYWFKPVEATYKDTPTMVSVSTHSTYADTQYSIWVATLNGYAPESVDYDRILSKANPKIRIGVKARKTVWVYKDGKPFGAPVITYPDIIWDNTGQVFENVTDDGIFVDVDYYGNQVFRLKAVLGKKAEVYIDATPEYKNILDAIGLSVVPTNLLIKDGSIDKGTSNNVPQANRDQLAPGVYTLDSNKYWQGAEFQSVFRVINRKTQRVELRADITQVGIPNKVYKSGDIFTPPNPSGGRYIFLAKIGSVASEQAILEVSTYTKLSVVPQYRRVDIDPDVIALYQGDSIPPKDVVGTVVVGNLSEEQANNWSPVMRGGIYRDNNGEWAYQEAIPEIPIQLLNYINGVAQYTFTYTINVGSQSAGTKLRYNFFPTNDDNGSAVNIDGYVDVDIVEDTTTFYLNPVGNEDQWTGIQAIPTQNDNLTFTAKKGSTVAKFTLEGSYKGIIQGSDGDEYIIDTDGTSIYEFEVKGDRVFTFTAKETGKKLTLNLKAFDVIVKIQCEPDKARLTAENPVALTIVRGETNKSDNFRFTVNGEDTIYEIPNGLASAGFEFTTRAEGKYTFTAYDDPSKTAVFNVGTEPEEPEPSLVTIQSNPPANSEANPYTGVISVTLTTSVPGWEIWYYRNSDSDHTKRLYDGSPISMSANDSIVANVKSPKGKVGPDITLSYFFNMGPGVNGITIIPNPGPTGHDLERANITLVPNPALPSGFSILKAVAIDPPTSFVPSPESFSLGNKVNLTEEGDWKNWAVVTDGTNRGSIQGPWPYRIRPRKEITTSRGGLSWNYAASDTQTFTLSVPVDSTLTFTIVDNIP